MRVQTFNSQDLNLENGGSIKNLTRLNTPWARNGLNITCSSKYLWVQRALMPQDLILLDRREFARKKPILATFGFCVPWSPSYMYPTGQIFTSALL